MHGERGGERVRERERFIDNQIDERERSLLTIKSERDYWER